MKRVDVMRSLFFFILRSVFGNTRQGAGVFFWRKGLGMRLLYCCFLCEIKNGEVRGCRLFGLIHTHSRVHSIAFEDS